MRKKKAETKTQQMEVIMTDRYKYKQLNPDINVTFQSLILKPVSITSSDISRGFVIRYFIQKQNYSQQCAQQNKNNQCTAFFTKKFKHIIMKDVI